MEESSRRVGIAPLGGADRRWARAQANCGNSISPLPYTRMVASRRGRTLIRAILFIVRLRREVQAQHRRTLRSIKRTAKPGHQQHGGAALGQQRDRPGLKRCESNRRPPQRQISRQHQHRNSAPSAVFLRSPTPQPLAEHAEPTIWSSGSQFDSFLRMAQPYQLRPASGHQLVVQPSQAHQLAARTLFRRRPVGAGGSLEQPAERGLTTAGGGSTASVAQRLFLRQSSVETGGSKSAKSQAAADGPRRKLKQGVVGLIGALTALEQNDMEALAAVLARNAKAIGLAAGDCFRVEDPLEGGVYGLFEPRLSLLDVALMLGRTSAARMLMDHGASDRAQVPSATQRLAAVETVLSQCEEIRANGLLAAIGRQEEQRRARLPDSQLAILRQMRSQLSRSVQPPSAPRNVRVECVSPSAACVQFELAEEQDDLRRAAIVRTRVQWSTCPLFSSLDGTRELQDSGLLSGRLLVDGLSLGGQLAFRVAAGSIWGWSADQPAEPPMLRISSWTELALAQEGPNGGGEPRPGPEELAELVEQVERHRQSLVWQRIFPSTSPAAEKDRRRKTGLRHLFSASSKFIKNVQRGLFLVTLFYTDGGEGKEVEGRILCTVDDCLPAICVDENATGLTQEDLHWLMKLSLCWEQLPLLQQESLGSATGGSANAQLRGRLVDAALAMHNALGVGDIGRLHHSPVEAQPGTSLLVTVRLVPEGHSSEAQGLAMRWMRMEKLLRRRQACPALESLSRELLPLLNFFESSLIPLPPGLYLAYLRLQSSLNSIHVLVPENLTSALPFALIRPNGHVTREEWAHLRALAQGVDSDGQPADAEEPSPEQRTFQDQLTRAARTLVQDLELEPDQLLGTRLFRHRLVRLGDQVSLILVMPRPEEVCQVNAAFPSSRCADPCGPPMAQLFRGCVQVPVPVFQIINLFAYQPDFLGAYCALSIFLEHFLTVVQFEQRQCLVESDARVYLDQLERLLKFQQQLESVWRSCSWISTFASVARDRGCPSSRGRSLPLTRLLRVPEDNLPPNCPASPSPLLQCASQISLSASQGGHSSCAASPSAPSPFGVLRAVHYSSLPGSPRTTASPQQRQFSAANGHFSVSADSRCSSLSLFSSRSAPSSSVLRVFAAFDTGLPQSFVSVRLSVSAHTTAREVVRLVVLQIVKLRPNRAMTNVCPDPGEHCLVSVLGARERRFRDEYPIMRMESPWDRGKLCVRHVRQIGRAIELANESAV